MEQSFKRITNCRACGSSNLRAYLDLASSPPANGLLMRGLPDPERIEVMMMLCEDCFLSQLSVVIDPDSVYKNYAYHSSVSKTFRDHCRSLAKLIKESFEFSEEKPRLLDIASNDGCLLREFAEEGYQVLGFEPCVKLAEACGQAGFPVFNDFFSERSSHTLQKRRFDVITATNVFAHVDDIQGFLAGVKHVLEPSKGIFVVEVPHMLSLLNNNQFDTIYHEHLSYFLLKPMIGLYERAGLEIFRVEQMPIHGGSIRVYAANPGTRPVDPSVEACLTAENDGGMFDRQTYKDFANWVTRLGADIRTVLDFTRRTGKKVMGYGASAKGISLTNYLGIGKYIHSIVDETPAKQGKLTPGDRIPIVGFDAFKAERPDYIILFAWNFADEMIEKTAHIGARYIVPIPTPSIVDAPVLEAVK